MLSISEFFKRFGGIQAREIAFRTAVQGAIKELLNIEIPIESISFKSGVVSLKNISSSARSVLFTKKTSVIERANKLQSIHIVMDIR